MHAQTVRTRPFLLLLKGPGYEASRMFPPSVRERSLHDSAQLSHFSSLNICVYFYSQMCIIDVTCTIYANNLSCIL